VFTVRMSALVLVEVVSNTHPIIVHGPMGDPYCSFQIESIVSGDATPSWITAKTSRLMAAQMRLKMNPVDSLSAVTGCSPALLSSSSRRGKIRSAVLPEVMSSTIRALTWSAQDPFQGGS